MVNKSQSLKSKNLGLHTYGTKQICQFSRPFLFTHKITMNACRIEELFFNVFRNSCSLYFVEEFTLCAAGAYSHYGKGKLRYEVRVASALKVVFPKNCFHDHSSCYEEAEYHQKCKLLESCGNLGWDSSNAKVWARLDLFDWINLVLCTALHALFIFNWSIIRYYCGDQNVLWCYRKNKPFPKVLGSWSGKVDWQAPLKTAQ